MRQRQYVGAQRENDDTCLPQYIDLSYGAKREVGALAWSLRLRRDTLFGIFQIPVDSVLPHTQP